MIARTSSISTRTYRIKNNNNIMQRGGTHHTNVYEAPVQ